MRSGSRVVSYRVGVTAVPDRDDLGAGTCQCFPEPLVLQRELIHHGHDGGLPGYLSYVLSTGDGERRLEVSVTIGAPDSADPEAVERFWAAFNTLLLTAACGATPTAWKVTGWEREGGRPGLRYQSGYSAWMSPSKSLQ